MSTYLPVVMGPIGKYSINYSMAQPQYNVPDKSTCKFIACISFVSFELVLA